MNIYRSFLRFRDRHAPRGMISSGERWLAFIVEVKDSFYLLLKQIEQKESTKSRQSKVLKV